MKPTVAEQLDRLEGCCNAVLLHVANGDWQAAAKALDWAMAGVDGTCLSRLWCLWEACDAAAIWYIMPAERVEWLIERQDDELCLAMAAEWRRRLDAGESRMASLPIECSLLEWTGG